MQKYAPRRQTFWAISLASLVATSSPVQAAIFDPGLIVSDSEIRQSNALSYPDMVQFLRSKGRLLEVADIDPVDGMYKNAAQIISDASARYSINPKYILALLQKESSVVENSGPLDQSRLIWAAGYALCDGCEKSAPLPSKYRGFAKQVDAGAAWMDWYLKNAQTNPSFKKAGDVVQYDNGSQVVARSTATAALYSYTPHLHGNKLLWRVLERWFGEGAEEVQQYPDGTVISDKTNGAVGVMQAGKLRMVSNQSVLLSRFGNVPRVSVANAVFASLKATGYATPIRFPDFSLVRDEAGTIYLLVGEQKRRIASPKAFSAIGFNPEEVEDVQSSDLKEYVDGAVLDVGISSSAVVGSLLQDAKTGGVYFVDGAQKHPVWDKALLSMRFGGMTIVPVKPVVLEKYANGDPVRLPEGALVKTKNDPSVYLVGGGVRRAFADEDAFFAVGYKWSDVVTVNPKLLALHPLGAPISDVVAISPEEMADTPQVISQQTMGPK